MPLAVNEPGGFSSRPPNCFYSDAA